MAEPAYNEWNAPGNSRERGTEVKMMRRLRPARRRKRERVSVEEVVEIVGEEGVPRERVE